MLTRRKESDTYLAVEVCHQKRFSVNVWAGIVGDYLVGPYVIPQRINGQTYNNFVENVLSELLEGVPLHVRPKTYFMHDGAPPHFSVDVRRLLNNRFHDRWKRWPNSLNFALTGPKPTGLLFVGAFESSCVSIPNTRCTESQCPYYGRL